MPLGRQDEQNGSMFAPAEEAGGQIYAIYGTPQSWTALALSGAFMRH